MNRIIPFYKMQLFIAILSDVAGFLNRKELAV
jgi:hypothetical protein